MLTDSTTKSKTVPPPFNSRELQGDAFPPFIRQSMLAQSNIELSKIFPLMGLTSCTEDIVLKASVKDIGFDKIAYGASRKFVTDVETNYSSFPFSERYVTEYFQLFRTLYILKALNNRFKKQEGIITTATTCKLTTPICMMDGSIVIKAGTNIITLVRELLHAGGRYSMATLPTKAGIDSELRNLKIVFTADEMVGAWDLATMSMRGIQSCMRWKSGVARSLVGSIADPCCGMLYITNGTMFDYGCKMLFRALVRVVVNDDGAPALLVERIYSSFYNNGPDSYAELDRRVAQHFVAFLKKKVPGMPVFSVVTDRKTILENYVMVYPPMPVMEHLSEGEMTYRDTGIAYSTTKTYENLKSKILLQYGAVKAKIKLRPKKKAAKSRIFH